MAEGMFSHLINIIFKTSGATKAITDTKKVRKAVAIPWDTKHVRGYEKKVRDAFGVIEKKAKGVGKAAKQAKPMMEQLGLAMKRAVIVAPVWMMMRSAMMGIIQLVKEQIKFLRDMEDAMARIKIVGKGTATELENLKYTLIGLSYIYGVSASDALEAAKIFAQQGKTVSETLVLTRTAMIGAQVLGKDVKVIVEDLTAAMKAFNVPAENATSIIDRLINVERQFAVTSKELSAGIKRTGATAHQMGVSMAALVGDLAAVVEVTRKAGKEAARGLQFIYARLLTTGKPVIEQLTGIKFYLDEQGEATHALTGVLRRATDILDDLAKKWKNLTNEQRLSIAVALGSKRQLVVMNALMQNYTRSIDARIAALTSAGESERALIIIQDTVTYKTQQLASAWNVLTATVADTSAWKAIIDVMSETIIVITKAINFEKGHRIELIKQNNEILNNIENRQSQISSIEELIRLRNKLLAKPPSDKTAERLEKINKAIKIITKEHPTIRLSLETGDPSDLRKSVQEISDELLKEKIAAQVSVEFILQLDALEKRRKELQKIIAGTMPDVAGIPFAKKILRAKESKELLKIDKERAKILEKQTEEEEKQLVLAKAQRTYQEIVDDEEALRLVGKLTEKELEQLDIERQLVKYKLLGNTTLEQQIQKRIELIKNSIVSYDLHDKTLKLEQLQNKLIDARLRKKEEERNKMASLALQYEKAGALERDRIRRVTELVKKTPQELAGIFETDLYDKSLILDYWTSFSSSAKRAIEDTIMRIEEISHIKTDFDLQMEAIEKLEQMLQGKGIKIGGAISATPAAISPVINQETMVNIGNIVGAIDNDTLDRILEEIKEKIKTSSSYIDDNMVNKIIEIIERDEAKQTKLGKTLSDNV